jgi:hypothetical protein
VQHGQDGYGAVDWRDHVIDYTREDFTKSEQRYDLILGANAHHSMFVYRRMLNEGGT